MKRVLALLTLTILIALAAPFAAHAAEGTPTVTPAILDVQLWPEDSQGPAMIAVAVLPTDAPLPCRVSLPVPKGVRLTWVGEIFPANDQEDIPRQPEVDGERITVTVEKSRYVQYEGQTGAVSERGDRRSASLDWVQTAPAERVRFAFRVPMTAEQVKTEPAYEGTPDTNQQGEKLYSVPERRLDVGQKLKLSIDYVSTSGQAGEGAGGGTDIALIVLLGLLAVAVVALVFVWNRQRQAG